MDSTKRYWFPAKKYGWGWGAPSTWQGWLVLALYPVGIGAAAVLIPPDQRPTEFFFLLAALTVVLLIVCWLKGEPPKWRWGDR